MARITIADLAGKMTIDRKTMRSIVGGSVGVSNIQDFSLTKIIDRSSPDLYTACCTGEHIGEATLTVVTAGDDGTLPINWDSGLSVSSISSDD